MTLRTMLKKIVIGWLCILGLLGVALVQGIRGVVR